MPVRLLAVSKALAILSLFEDSFSCARCEPATSVRRFAAFEASFFAAVIFLVSHSDDAGRMPKISAGATAVNGCRGALLRRPQRLAGTAALQQFHVAGRRARDDRGTALRHLLAGERTVDAAVAQRSQA